MKAYKDFIVSPIGERYNNSKKINGKDLILNTEIFNHQFINRLHFNIGKIESQKFMIMGQLQSAQSAVSGLQELFLNEYGSYDVNLEDGTINWPKEGEEIENEK